MITLYTLNCPKVQMACFLICNIFFPAAAASVHARADLHEQSVIKNQGKYKSEKDMKL